MCGDAHDHNDWGSTGVWVGEARWPKRHGVSPLPGCGCWFAEKTLGFVRCLGGNPVNQNGWGSTGVWVEEARWPKRYGVSPQPGCGCCIAEKTLGFVRCLAGESRWPQWLGVYGGLGGEARWPKWHGVPPLHGWGCSWPQWLGVHWGRVGKLVDRNGKEFHHCLCVDADSQKKRRGSSAAWAGIPLTRMAGGLLGSGWGSSLIEMARGSTTVCV